MNLIARFLQQKYVVELIGQYQTKQQVVRQGGKDLQVLKTSVAVCFLYHPISKTARNFVDCKFLHTLERGLVQSALSTGLFGRWKDTLMS